MQPLRALLRPSASKVSGGPAPPETPVTGPTLPSVEVQPVGVRRRSNAPYVVDLHFWWYRWRMLGCNDGRFGCGKCYLAEFCSDASADRKLWDYLSSGPKKAIMSLWFVWRRGLHVFCAHEFTNSKNILLDFFSKAPERYHICVHTYIDMNMIIYSYTYQQFPSLQAKGHFFLYRNILVAKEKSPPKPQNCKVVKVNSDTSSNSMDAPIATWRHRNFWGKFVSDPSYFWDSIKKNLVAPKAPPTEPAPAMGACDPRISAPSNTLSAEGAEGDLTTTMNSSPRASLTRSRRGSTMTEKVGIEGERWVIFFLWMIFLWY